MKDAADKVLGAVLVALIAGALVGGVLQAMQSGGDEWTSDGTLAKGTLAPPILAIRNSDMKTITTDDLKGKVVVIDFWGTWCGPCRVEAPRVRDIAHDYSSKSELVVLALSTTSEGEPESPETVAPFVKLHHLEEYPVAYPDTRMMQQFSVPGFPTLYVIGKDGKIRFGGAGLVPAERLRAEIDAALKG